NHATITTTRSPTSASARGGGLYFAGTELRLVNGARVIDNVARAEASASSTAYGGGAAVYGALTATGATITTNAAASMSPNTISGGGGRYGENASARLEACEVSGNDAEATRTAGGINGSGVGGGLYLFARSGARELTIARSTIAGNRADGTRISLGGG